MIPAVPSVDVHATTTAATLPSPRRAGVVWGAALFAYVIAVLDRSSFGVAGLVAGERFGANASVLASFVVVQLVVYAALQLPVGIVLDRLGPRRLIAAGAILLAAGQLALALVTTTGGALGARALVGAGDALTFVSVVRLVPAWFPPRRVPRYTQLTGIVGQLGQLLAAVPLVMLLHGPGWRTAFASVAALGAVAAIGVIALVRDAPDPGPAAPGPTASVSEAHAGGGAVVTSADVPLAAAALLPSRLGATLREPGTWLGYWTHFTSQFSGTVIILLWGFPFLVQGQGLTTGQASALFSVNVLTTIVSGLVIGELSGRYPAWRLRIVVGVVAAQVLAWALVLAPSGPRPLWVLTVFMVVIATGGPISLVGFDFARSHNPLPRLGTATGLINAGGFVAALSTMLGVGLVLDAVGSGADGNYALDAYRLALGVVVVVPFAIGAIGLAVSARQVARTTHQTPGQNPLVEES